MTQHNKIQLFEEKKVRAIWDDEAEKWYFSIVDVVAVLTESPNPQTYWRVLKKRLKDEGNETVTNCNGLKMLAPDGKMRKTDVADTEQLFRLIQSIPSPKAEPFKQMSAAEKLFLDNSNLMYAFNRHPEIGTVRETYFYNQTCHNHELNAPKQGDFLVDGQYTFEVGGADKRFEQIKDLPDNFLAIDDVEFGRGNKIPLWLFGFLY